MEPREYHYKISSGVKPSNILLSMSNLELYMTATERTEDTEEKYSVLSVFSVAKSYKKHTRFSIMHTNKIKTLIYIDEKVEINFIWWLFILQRLMIKNDIN